MSRYTSAYSSLLQQLKEVEILQRDASRREREDAVGLRREINASCRAAIVLLCARLEGYIEELGVVALQSIHMKQVSRDGLAPQLFYHLSKDLLKEVGEATAPERIAASVFAFLDSDLPLWGRRGPFPVAPSSHRFNEGFSNPSFDKIRAYFNRFGYANYSRDLGRLLKAEYMPVVNLVNHLVDTRNQIAHGDAAATKPPRDVHQMTLMIRKYCGATDSVFGAWCKSNMCCIRSA